MTLLCIDVSKWQGNINFAAVKAAGDALVFMKATEGTGYVDPQFRTFRAQARSAGLVRGFYGFASAGDPVAEADAFCAAVSPLEVGDLVALDWETTHPNPPAWCKAWLDRVSSKLGVKPLIYMNQSTRDGFDWTPVVSGDYGLWLAAYTGTPAVPPSGLWPTVAIKQYTSSGSVPGIGGNVDQDVFYGDATTLARYGKQGGTPATTPGGFLMALTDAQQNHILNGIDILLTQVCGETYLKDGVWGWPLPGGGKKTIVDMLRDIHSVPTLTAADIAASIPAAQANAVIDALGKRITTTPAA